MRASDGSQTADTTVTVNVTDVDEAVAVDPPAEEVGQSTPQTVSEPDGKGSSADTTTGGRVALGETATGNIGSADDRDWFAVEMMAGAIYTIDLRGRRTGGGGHADVCARRDREDGGGADHRRHRGGQRRDVSASAERTLRRQTRRHRGYRHDLQQRSAADIRSEPDGQDLPAGTTTTGVVAAVYRPDGGTFEDGYHACIGRFREIFGQGA